MPQITLYVALVIADNSRMSALSILQKTYGYHAFRGQQQAVIDQVIAGENAFVLMPTGGGKSLCYQIPALCRDGVGIIVSPLIALMKNQVDALLHLGINAASIHSGLDDASIRETKQQLRAGTLKMLYVAPERLLMDDFLDLLDGLRIALFAIDEAHCVSQWGHDFRPHYTQLSLLATRFPRVPRIALTATADMPTRRDIVERLGLSESQVFIDGFDRPNIHYAILPKENARQQILHFIRENYAGESGIVYCLSRKQTDETALWLADQGFQALPYHAGLDATVRATNQERFLREEAVIMVATIAFGMGIDKPDVRFVAHLSIPKNIEAYYQETGRAGRDGLPAHALMVYGMADAAMQRGFIENSTAADQQKRIEHQKLNALLGLCEAASCRRQIILDYFGDSSTPCGNCDTCLQPPETFDGTLAAQKALSVVYRTGQRFGVGYLVDVLLGVSTDRIIQFGHASLGVFGLGVEHSKREWQSIFRQLVAASLLQVDSEEHGGLSITPQGKDFLKEKKTLAMRMEKKTATTKALKRAVAEAAVFEAPEDHQLFTALKNQRTELAKAENIPPYIIFHDKTLREMAVAKPASRLDLLAIGGVGEHKVKRYGEAFLEVIAAFAA